MNKSLLARTRPEFYATAIEIARKHGVTEEEIAEQVAADTCDFMIDYKEGEASN